MLYGRPWAKVRRTLWRSQLDYQGNAGDETIPQIIIIIILGLISLALLLIARFLGEHQNDPIAKRLRQALVRAQAALRSFPRKPTAEECERLRAALRELNSAIANVPPGLRKYNRLKGVATRVRDAIARLLAQRCGG